MPGRLTDEQRKLVLEAVGQGVHPPVACTAAGLGKGYFHDLRYRARKGDEVAREFLLAIDAAESRAEVDAVASTHRATQPIEERKIICPHCDAEYTTEPEQLAALAMQSFDAVRAKALSAEVAIKKLERRHPKRWSQKVVHTIAEEHDRLLDVAQRVLAPDVFELLLEEYLAGGEGESETPSGPGGQAEGSTH